MRKIPLSNNTVIECHLVVYKDYTESTGKWRLFWANNDNPYLGVNEQSTVTGNPFFDTKKEAIAYGLKHHNETATIAVFHRS